MDVDFILVNHHMCIEDTIVLARVDHFLEGKLYKSMEIVKKNIRLHMDDYFKMSRSWIFISLDPF